MHMFHVVEQTTNTFTYQKPPEDGSHHNQTKMESVPLLIVSYLLICLPATDRHSIKLLLDAS